MMRGFKMEMQDASRVVDVYSNLAANTAVSQQELAEAMTRTASSMESVGATFEDTSAMIATVVKIKIAQIIEILYCIPNMLGTPKTYLLY